MAVLITTLQLPWPENRLKMYIMSNSTVDGLQSRQVPLQPPKSGYRLIKSKQLKTGENVAWSNKSRFLLMPTDGRPVTKSESSRMLLGDAIENGEFCSKNVQLSNLQKLHDAIRSP